MQRRERQSCGAICANEAARMPQIERFFRAILASWKIWTNKSWLYVGTRSCIYIFVLLQKQEYILQPDWSCLAEAPPMTRIRVCCVTLVNFTREWSEFEAKSRVKFTTQQARIRVMGVASARQLQSGCKMYSCFCKSTKMYIQLRVPTYNHDLFVLHCCFGFSASARNDVTARASSWLVNAVRISAKIQIFQLALFTARNSCNSHCRIVFCVFALT